MSYRFLPLGHDLTWISSSWKFWNSCCLLLNWGFVFIKMLQQKFIANTNIKNWKGWGKDFLNQYMDVVSSHCAEGRWAWSAFHDPSFGGSLFIKASAQSKLIIQYWVVRLIFDIYSFSYRLHRVGKFQLQPPWNQWMNQIQSQRQEGLLHPEISTNSKNCKTWGNKNDCSTIPSNRFSFFLVDELPNQPILIRQQQVHNSQPKSPRRVRWKQSYGLLQTVKMAKMVKITTMDLSKLRYGGLTRRVANSLRFKSSQVGGAFPQTEIA